MSRIFFPRLNEVDPVEHERHHFWVDKGLRQLPDVGECSLCHERTGRDLYIVVLESTWEVRRLPKSETLTLLGVTERVHYQKVPLSNGLRYARRNGWIAILLHEVCELRALAYGLFQVPPRALKADAADV